jgi:cation diffusion facilitator family transporter
MNEARQARFAMRLSLAVGVLLLVGKVGAWWHTGSSAIFADAAESVIHVAAVGFAAFSLRLSQRPANARFPFGYEKIAFFSAGFEGALIMLAAVSIIASAVVKWLRGLELGNIGAGAGVVVAAALVNAVLGWYLVRTGRRTHSLILEANGKHVLTDFWTSAGVAIGLALVLATGWQPFDPLCAIAVALQILWSGGQLVSRSIGGLLDYADPATGGRLREQLDALSNELGVAYHGVRYRHTGHRLVVIVHLLFPYGTPVGEAHRIATAIEERLPGMLDVPAEVVTHLEALEDHARVHREGHHSRLEES